MRGHEQWRRFIFVVAACGLALSGGGARAAIISTSPTLPPLDAPFVSAGGVGCFPAAGVCVQPGSLTFDSVASTMFVPAGQDIVANASYQGTLTTLSNTPIGPVTLSGTVEELVLGRTFSTQTGTWSTELVAMLLTGPVLGHTLTLALGGTPSTGMTSIEAIADDLFKIDSFFDIFVQLSLDSVPPLSTTRGPIHAELAPAGVPEPSVVALLAAALLGLVGVQWRRRAHRTIPAAPRAALQARQERGRRGRGSALRQPLDRRFRFAGRWSRGAFGFPSSLPKVLAGPARAHACDDERLAMVVRQAAG